MSNDIKIMLVDDHEMILDSLSLLFKLMEGVSIEAKESDSRKVIDRLKNLTIDILVTDYNMPNIDGIQLTTLVKEYYPTIKILLLTVNEDAEDIQNAFHAGASGYIMKKADRHELLSALQMIMEGKMYFGQEAMKAMFSSKVNNPKNDETQKIKIASLTAREREIIKLLSQELSSIEIAEKLYISSGTVETHRHNILKKIGAKTTIGVVKFALKTGLI